ARFVATTCSAEPAPYQPLAIVVGLGSNVGQAIAAEIAGAEWVDRHVGEWVFGESGRTRAQEKWRERGTTPPDWPFKILRKSISLWLAPFEGLPTHLTWLWTDATWLGDDRWQARDPDRPAGWTPCVAEIAGHWRLWLPPSAPDWPSRFRDWR